MSLGNHYSCNPKKIYPIINMIKGIPDSLNGIGMPLLIDHPSLSDNRKFIIANIYQAAERESLENFAAEFTRYNTCFSDSHIIDTHSKKSYNYTTALKILN